MNEKLIPDTTESEDLSEPVGYDAAHPDDTLFVIGPCFPPEPKAAFSMILLGHLNAMDVQQDRIRLTSVVLKGVPSLTERITSAQKLNKSPDALPTADEGFGFGVVLRNKKREVVRAVYFAHCNPPSPPTLHVQAGDNVCYETLTLCFSAMVPWTEGLPPA